jgi:hypothetical protein
MFNIIGGKEERRKEIELRAKKERARERIERKEKKTKKIENGRRER